MDVPSSMKPFLQEKLAIDSNVELNIETLPLSGRGGFPQSTATTQASKLFYNVPITVLT